VSTDGLASLMVVRVQGIASLQRAAAALDVSEEDARQRLNALAAEELVSERTGRVAGFSLTPKGAETFDKLLAEEGLRTSEDLRDRYDRFMTVDPLVKRTCSRSQSDGPEAALDDLLPLHDKARSCLRKIAQCAPRYATYLTRLDRCVERLSDGDHTAFTKPLAESYHQVWWELHQDLLLTLGLEREE
jgi:hypothetical protein